MGGPPMCTPRRAAGVNPNSAANSRSFCMALRLICTAGCGISVPLPATVVRPLFLIAKIAQVKSAHASQ